MIAFLKGTVQEQLNQSAIIAIGGIGYEVHCIARDCTKLTRKKGEEVELHTHHYLRENAAELYGFFERAERDMFVVLIGISGIGPKGALNILNAASLDVLQRAIVEGDASVLTRVSGIGTRIAQKIIVELKDTFAEEWGALPGDIVAESDVVEALEMLGYSKAQAQRALKEVPQDLASTQDKVKAALKALGKAQ
jgi:holliday junction DNA helicase RuvA